MRGWWETSSGSGLTNEQRPFQRALIPGLSMLVSVWWGLSVFLGILDVAFLNPVCSSLPFYGTSKYCQLYYQYFSAKLNFQHSTHQTRDRILVKVQGKRGIDPGAAPTGPSHYLLLRVGQLVSAGALVRWKGIYKLYSIALQKLFFFSVILIVFLIYHIPSYFGCFSVFSSPSWILFYMCKTVALKIVLCLFPSSSVKEIKRI